MIDNNGFIRSSRLQIFFKIGVLKNFKTNVTNHWLLLFDMFIDDLIPFLSRS